MLTELRRANKALRDAAAKGDVLGCVEADQTFHQILMSLSGNETLSGILDELKAKMRLMEGKFFRVDSAQASASGHDEIIKHLSAGDPVEAGNALRKNWEHGYEVLNESPADGKGQPR